MTKKKVRKEGVYEVHIENDILEALTKLGYVCWKNYDQASYINGAYRRNKWQRKGVSDIIALLRPRSGETTMRVLFLEVKTPKGKQSVHQCMFEDDVKAFGGIYHVVHSVVEAIRIVRKYDSISIDVEESTSMPF